MTNESYEEMKAQNKYMQLLYICRKEIIQNAIDHGFDRVLINCLIREAECGNPKANQFIYDHILDNDLEYFALIENFDKFCIEYNEVHSKCDCD